MNQSTIFQTAALEKASEVEIVRVALEVYKVGVSGKSSPVFDAACALLQKRLENALGVSAEE